MTSKSGEGAAPAGGGSWRDVLTVADAAQVDDLVRSVRDVLGKSVVAMCLTGSATTDGLCPNSDLDLLVVIDRPLRDLARPLAREVAARSGWERGRRPVELTVLVQDAVRPWRYPPPRELQFGEWLRDEFEVWLESQEGAAPWGGPDDPDVAILVAQARESAVTLLGPAPAEVFDPVPFRDVRAASLHGIDDLLGNLEPDTRNVLLTFARILVTVRTQRIVGKAVAATDVSSGDDLAPDLRAVLLLARDAYLGTARDDWTEHRAGARRLADHLVALIRAEG